ncbi:MAG: uroporphyrinogen-III synthase [Ilumatobacteraceae bacterium]
MVGDGPLAGRRVVVTRPEEQAAPLVELLEAAGATAIVTPLIDIVDAQAELDVLSGLDPADFDWVVVTSRNAALRLMATHGRELGNPRRDSSRPAIAVIGAATARVVAPAQLVPDVQSAAGLLATMPPRHGGGRVLVVQAADAAPTLVTGLRAGGWEVVVNSPYSAVPAHPPARAQLAALAADAVLFASGSAARAWVGVFGTTTPPVIVVMGPQTAAATLAAGLTVTVTADDHSLPGLVSALARALSGHSPG